ncbi:MAG: hypothetical protein IT350_05590 [Deltaproteobacteria bacterium]|nr:hypothetical protein [Deltaproteobacteria bacterium]
MSATAWWTWGTMLVLALALPGCGDDDDDDVTGTFDDGSGDDDVSGDDDATDDDVTDDDADDNSGDDDSADDDTSDDDTTDDDTTDDDTGDDDWPACADYANPVNVGNLEHPDISETSGLAISAKNLGVLWAHNDSGDGPYAYAMTLAGETLGRVALTGATASDWEDMAVGPCGADECLYLADIGDNGASRTDAGIYRVVEPEIDAAVPFADLALGDWEHMAFTYADGPRDAEAIAVHPDETIYLFSKLGGTSEVFAFPVWDDVDPVQPDYLGDLDTGTALALVTGADIHRNGNRVLLRTYVSALEWRVPEGGVFEDILTESRTAVPAAIELQGESIAYDPATGGYFHASEGSSPILYFIDCD